MNSPEHSPAGERAGDRSASAPPPAAPREAPEADLVALTARRAPAGLAPAASPGDFRAALRSRTILCDGAMGTMIYAAGVYINQNFDNLNLIRPQLVKNIHNQYAQAGAEILQTNTFGATRRRLGRFGLEDKLAEINLAGARLAREAAEGHAWVAGSAGPLPEAVAPHGALAPEEARAEYAGQIRALLQGGVDLLLFESFDQLEMLVEGVRAARELDAAIPIVAQMRFTPTSEARYGATPEKAARALAALGVDAVGVNCVDAEDAVGIVERLRSATDLPVSAQPNIGFPKYVEDRLLYLATPEYLMEYTRRMMQKGARIIGACCGSTPDHIRSIRSSVRMLQPGAPEEPVQSVQITSAAGETRSRAIAAAAPPRPVETPSRLAALLRSGGFAVSIEIDPPVGTEAARALAAATQCRDAGVHCINIADGPRATARMGPVDMAILLMREVEGIEPVAHFCCRDRNLLGMQADMIGANALGIYNILIITGDPPKLGDYPFATAVYDVDAIGALRIGSNLNAGRDLAGAELRGAPARLFLGCGANPGAIDLDTEIARLERKLEAGAEYILTQPVYDPRRFERFIERAGRLRAPLLLGLLPLASYRNAEFLSREVPGMDVPSDILERMRRREDKESARLEGIEIAREALLRCLPAIQGVYIMPPFNRVDSALAVLEALPEDKRLKPRK